jgi:succinate dehydrogenase/fumarate reductase flavoprotein subunit
MEDYHLAQNGGEWADRILNPGKAAENQATENRKSPPTQEIEESLGINVLPGEISSAAEKDNRKLRKKLQQIMNEYQESAQKAEELEKTNRILTQGFQKVARQRVAELEARMGQLTENMIEISEMFEESQKGNGIAILIRFSGVLEKATKILDICRKGIAKKAI